MVRIELSMESEWRAGVASSVMLNEFARLKRFAAERYRRVILGGCIRGREVAQWVSMKKHPLIYPILP